MFRFTSFRRAATSTIFAALTAGSGVALAANDGTVGSTSTGNLTISAVVPQLVRISGFTDISLGTWDGVNPMTATKNLCVWSTTRKYNIKATGDGASSAFTLKDNTTPTPNTIAYAPSWASTSGATSGTAFAAPNTALTGQTSSATSTNCGASTNATLLISISASTLAAAPANTYTGVLTLIVAPE